jgi:anaerobic ribonucleoside-triphosphate reductase activating protein
MSVVELSDWILRQEGVEGITISGGEPTLQSEELVHIIDRVRVRRDLGIVCYTGRTIESLRRSGNDWIVELLGRVDLLIDGPYVRSKHASLLWRASTNQRLIVVSDRYRAIIDGLCQETDKSAGIEFTASDKDLLYAGVPSSPTFESDIQDGLNCARTTIPKPSRS